MPEDSMPGNYTMYVSGTTNGYLGGKIFENETALSFQSKQASIFIQTDKVVYNRLQTGMYMHMLICVCK